jgi:hypothetical protein
MRRRNMESSDQSKLDFFSHNMTINLYVLSSFMINRICSYVKGCFAVTKQKSSLRMRDLKILKKMEEPSQFTACSSHRTIFRFSKGSGNHWLLLWTSKKSKNHLEKCRNQKLTGVYQGNHPNPNQKKLLNDKKRQ